MNQSKDKKIEMLEKELAQLKKMIISLWEAVSYRTRRVCDMFQNFPVLCPQDRINKYTI